MNKVALAAIVTLVLVCGVFGATLLLDGSLALGMRAGTLALFFLGAASLFAATMLSPAHARLSGFAALLVAGTIVAGTSMITVTGVPNDDWRLALVAYGAALFLFVVFAVLSNLLLEVRLAPTVIIFMLEGLAAYRVMSHPSAWSFADVAWGIIAILVVAGLADSSRMHSRRLIEPMGESK